MRSRYKALSYIKYTSFSEITIPKIFYYVDVSIRTLEYGFQEKFLVSPNQYIKAIKLNNVRNEILMNKSNPVISEIAKKHGFNHMGQFAIDIKKQFDESPSHSFKLKK